MQASTFRQSVRLALQDSHLRHNMDVLTQRMRANRSRAWSVISDPDRVRAMGRAARRNAIARLPQLLAQLEARAQANGITVHWAETAADVHNIVGDLVKQYNARLIIKSKSMTSEEVHLNAALEAVGAQVVETDLGEYILQLAEEPPSHIVAPAAHLSLRDVASIFAEKLGVPLTLSPQRLTELARQRLRRVFLRADMGISGVNFAVASTGTLVVVTNEGNGRMVTSLPRVHVALMGIDKVVATMADLGVLLQVLPRSATGQALTTYVSFINGPRRAENDGPENVHLIILDNGRSTLLAQGLGETLTCIRCAACMNACPVYREIGGQAYGSTYPGPIGSVISPFLWLDPSGASPRQEGDIGQLEGQPAGVLAACRAELPFASSLCGACRDVCPVGINLPQLLVQMRSRVRDQELRQDAEKRLVQIWAWVMARPGRMRRLAESAGRLGRLLWRGGWVSRLPGSLGQWTGARDFPLPASRSFRTQWRKRARHGRS